MDSRSTGKTWSRFWWTTISAEINRNAGWNIDGSNLATLARRSCMAARMRRWTSWLATADPGLTHASPTNNRKLDARGSPVADAEAGLLDELCMSKAFESTISLALNHLALNFPAHSAALARRGPSVPHMLAHVAVTGSLSRVVKRSSRPSWKEMVVRIPLPAEVCPGRSHASDNNAVRLCCTLWTHAVEEEQDSLTKRVRDVRR
mmetsp:Transcript_33829/g.77217  ORF Transcript_33829/g.77217 Transcript_33829/m.77217 type:complete len:205 (-) Transcript_33829:89-703(-)